MYKIIEIRPTSGSLQYVHSTMENRECEIVEITVGERGMLRVDWPTSYSLEYNKKRNRISRWESNYDRDGKHDIFIGKN